MTTLQRTTENPVVELLLDPRNYPDRPSKVELVETHISWVFLADRYAYKLKKPVCFEFLDFRTVDDRRQACDDEYRLNRRLSPDVYLGVVPVTRGSLDRLSIGGDGTAVDWLVKMRRLPADRTLENLIRNDQLRPEQVEAVASALANFYTLLGPLTVTPGEYLLMIEDHVRANHAELAGPQHGLSQLQIDHATSMQLRFLCLARRLFEERVVDGRVVEGHGDLRPEHIYIERRPAIIDCVEFSEDLRTIDVADELSFLAMECERLGATQVGQRILDVYARANNDCPPSALLDFYKCYRACVRAKVSVLRDDQVSDHRATRQMAAGYLALAENYAQRLGPPFAIVIRGLMGSGKSTLANELNKHLHARVLRTDVLRDKLLGRNGSQLAYGDGRYDATSRRAIYDELFRQAESNLKNSLPVILDGTFLTNDLRERAYELAQQNGAIMLFIQCECPEDVARARIRHRIANGQDTSEARPELLAAQMLENQPSLPVHRTLCLDTNTPLDRQVQDVLVRLREEFHWS